MWEQLGPNVSISANARIGPGARLIHCIILDDVEIKVCTSFQSSILQIQQILFLKELIFIGRHA